MTETPDAVEEALRDLKVDAPVDLDARVLTQVGLADAWTNVESPVGLLFVAHNPEGISAVAPADDVDQFRDIHATRTGRVLGVEAGLSRRTHAALIRTFETGKLGSLRLDLRGLTEFQRAVLRKTAEIPSGELRPYGWVAREIGNPAAVRAVGSALNKNPVPVLIPCHRVGRSDGTIGEYAFGAAMKRELLAHEGADPAAIDAQAARGIRLTGSTTTHIFCHPTCRHARRIGDRHRVHFRSAAEAAGAGYRACKVCRPAAA